MIKILLSMGLAFKLQPSIECLFSSQPTFQRWINDVSTLWINLEITLIRRWKCNKIRRRIFNVTQRWYNVGSRLKERENNVAQRWYKSCINLNVRLNAVSTSVKAILTDRASDDHRFVNRTVFILLNEKNYFCYKILKNFLTVAHIVIHNSGNNGDIKPPWKI